MAFDAERTSNRGGKPSGDIVGKQLTLDDLPPADTTRWVMRRKALVVDGVRQGVLTLYDACARYGLSEEEFLSWQRLIDKHGPRALRITRLQDYRRDDAPQQPQIKAPPRARLVEEKASRVNGRPPTPHRED